MDRRLPRSPALKSPVLSPTSPAIYEKYKSGCAWGLIHFFDFRQSHSHGKLIPDKKLANRQSKGDGYTRNRPKFLSNEKDQCLDDAIDNKNLAVNSRQPEVKKVREEEMSVKQQTRKNTAFAVQFNPKINGHAKDHRKASKSSKKSCRSHSCGCDAAAEGYWQPSGQNMVDHSPNRNNLVSATEASSSDVHINKGGNYSCKSIGGHTEINVRAHTNEEVEAFVNQKLTDWENLSRHEVANQSRNFIDALEVLNSNKELFMKLLQDPNSLLVKHIQDLRDSQAKKQHPQCSSKAKTSECQPKEEREFDWLASAQMFDSCDRCLSKGSDMPQSSNTMVVLKAGIQNCPNRISNLSLPQPHYSLMKKERSVKQAFLSFEHMKTKLRHVMRMNKKEQFQMSLDGICKSPHDFEMFKDYGKEISKQANESISASKSYLTVGKMSEASHEVNRRDGMGQAQNFGSGNGSKAASSIESCHRTLNLLTEKHLEGKFHPRNHLSDMLNRGNEDFSRKQTLTTLDRLMSLSEYDLFDALNPEGDKEHGFPSSQMRFSAYSNLSTAKGYKWRVQKEKKNGYLNSSRIKNLGAQPVLNNEKQDDCLQSAKKNISGDLSSATKRLQPASSLDEDLNHKVNQTSICPRKVMERNHADRWDECETNALEVALEPDSVQNTKTNQRTEAVNIFGESEYSECLKLDSPSGDQTSSSLTDACSSSPLGIQRAEDSDGMVDRAEQSSPISVLEQFFVDNNTSSASTISLSAEPPLEPFCINIEELHPSSLVESHLDLQSNAGTSMDMQGSLSECIIAVLQISGLNWDELSRKWHLLDQILDAFLFGNVVVWPEKSSTDRRLLFGYISEVLLEIYQCYFRSSPWVSLPNTRPRPALLSKNMVHEVLRQVDWSLFSELPRQTLQQVVEKDLAKSGTWMDIRLDTEEVVTELVESILEGLVMEFAIQLQT